MSDVLPPKGIIDPKAADRERKARQAAATAVDANLHKHVGMDRADWERIDPRVARAARPELGVNAQGLPETLIVYNPGRDTIGQIEQAGDIHLDTQAIRKTATGYDVGPEHISGLSIICPRCNQSLFLRGPSMTIPGNFRIDVHWNDLKLSHIDNRVRPTVTVAEVIACQYADHEVAGLVSPRSVSKCGWRGRLEQGQLYDVAKRQLIT